MQSCAATWFIATIIGSNHSREAGRGPHRVATYNEVIINRLDWELSLPHAVEAFVFVLRRARCTTNELHGHTSC